MPTQVRCNRIKLKPGSVPRVREWAAHITSHRREALATLRREGVTIESAFLEHVADADYLIYYMRSHDFGAASAEGSPHPIDAYHQAFKRDCWEQNSTLDLLVDLEAE